MNDLHQKILAELCEIHKELKAIRKNMPNRDMVLAPEEEQFGHWIYDLQHSSSDKTQPTAAL